MQKFITAVLKLFNIDNQLLIVALDFLIIFNRFIIMFFNASYHVVVPENYYFAGITVGQDYIASTVYEAYRLLHHLPMSSASAYGYGIIIPTTWILALLINIGVCNLAHQSSCQFLLYDWTVSISILGFILLCFLLIKDRSRQAFALLFFIAFLLGIPGGRGIENGNIDIILAFLYGLLLFLQKQALSKTKYPYVYTICIGIIAGVLLETKLFLLPIVVILLVTSSEPIIFFVTLVMACIVITLAPMVYGVTPIPLLVILRGEKFLTQVTNNVYSMYTYGNNNTRAMVGGVIFTIPFLRSNIQLRSFLISFFGLILFAIILFFPFLSFIQRLLKKLHSFSFQERLQYPFFIVLNCYATASIILWPGFSYDYRFFYLLPLIFILIDNAKTTLEKQFLGIAVSSFIVRSMFVLHTRIWHIFLILFFYFFLWVCISEWLQRVKGNK